MEFLCGLIAGVVVSVAAGLIGLAILDRDQP